ncbi:NADPH-dependent FMN reductase [Georgenia sp. MJ206]|uniref:NADPH-dependent FMN reductase n=1 Tax=Georgenia wangjunii TaxID=3117730 RepID=UPI002F26CF93
MSITIGYVVGSLSKDSINRKLAEALVALADDDLTFTEIPIGDLPLYDYDSDGDYPQVGRALKEQLRASDGLLFVTPEYNRTIPAALKNALEWGSRPYGDSAFTGIPAGVIGASTGEPGTAMAQQHLRNVLAYLDVPTLGQPEAFIHYTPERFADDGTVVDDSTREFLHAWLAAYTAWVRRFATQR